MQNFLAGWHLIYTKPRHEKKVYSQLIEKNVGSFLPTKKSLRVWHDRKKYVDEPLFPSYVFIYLNDIANYYEGMETEGSLYYVRTGKKIARVGESVIQNIRLAVTQVEGLEVSEARFQAGRKLVISKGALTGLSCEIVQVGNKEKLLVRVDLLQRNLLLSLPVDHFILV